MKELDVNNIIRNFNLYLLSDIELDSRYKMLWDKLEYLMGDMTIIQTSNDNNRVLFENKKCMQNRVLFNKITKRIHVHLSIVRELHEIENMKSSEILKLIKYYLNYINLIDKDITEYSIIT